MWGGKMDVIKNDGNTNIGANIRRIRKEKNIGQTKLIQKIDLTEWDFEVNLTREALVKIERGNQHIKVSQLKAIKVVLDTTYDELLR